MATTALPSSTATAAPAIPFAVAPAKLLIPAPRSGSVSRTALVNRLRAVSACPIVTLVAPAGYGKTTVLAQWAERDARPFAWFSVDERDNDPAVLLRHLAAALNEIEPLEPAVLAAVGSRRRSIWAAAVPRLGAAIASLEFPSVLVLDDVSRLRSEESVEALSALLEHVPEGSTLVLAGRALPPLRIAALRARGRLFEIGPELLALSRREAELLLNTAGIELTAEQKVDLVGRSEGWAAGLYLAAMAVRDGHGDADERGDFGGADRYLADYFRAECLSDLTPAQRDFLERTSPLEAMNGSLCDAVLGRNDSALQLEAIERVNLFVVPLDRGRDWYRFHGLFRDLLRHELELHEPESVTALNSRAADWFEAHARPEAAVDYAAAAGDTDRVARLVGSLVPPAYHGSRITTVERWLGLFADESQLERHPTVALLGAWVHALRGRSAQAEHWLAVAERCQCEGVPAATDAWIAVVRAALCRDGIDQMLADAQLAVAQLSIDSPWRPAALLLEGIAHALLGDDERADAILVEVAHEAERLGASDIGVAATSERAIIAASRNDHAAADTLARDVRGLASGEDREAHPTRALELAVSARAFLRRGRWHEAQSELASARLLGPRLTHALPWLAVQARLEQTRAYITLRNGDEAAALLAELGPIFGRRPRLGVLAAQADELTHEVETMVAAQGAKESHLTAAEVRLLPLLTTHLSFREISERLFVSRNTVKTQAISVYRKLGVSSRSEAIEEAAQLGLLDVATARPFATSSSMDDAAA